MTSRVGPLAAFAAFGIFWGAWAAILPDVKAQVGASKGELGLALLFVALAALPSMLATGAVVDRAGKTVVAPALVLFAAAILLPALAHRVWTLSLALLALGLASGVLEVAANSAAAAYESVEGRRLMQAGHALFSAGVVVASAAAGLARAAGASPFEILVATAAAVAVCAVPNRRPLRLGARTAPSNSLLRGGLSRPLVALGLLCAVAFVVESGGENWSALFLENRLGAGPAIGGLGPATFAAAMVAGRTAATVMERRLGDARLLATGALVATAGLAVVAVAPAYGVALVGLALAGAGVAVAAPTIFGAAGRSAGDAGQGRAVATVTTVAYLGFLGAPPLIGAVAGALGLRTAFFFLAAVAATFGALAATRGRARRSASPPAPAPRP